MVNKKPAVLAVIPARGGSKGVPRKNIRPLSGRPLIEWSIGVALASPSVTGAVVSTDDPEIAAVAARAGLPVPFIRPAELARDTSPTIPVLQHALREMEGREGVRYDAVVLLEPTSPLRSVEDVEAAVQKLFATGCDSVISLVELQHAHPLQVKRIEDDRIVPFGIDEPEGIRRQDLQPKAYIRNGAVYVTRREVLLAGSIRGRDSRPLLMPANRSVNIDDELDFLRIEAMIGLGLVLLPGAAP